MSRWLDTCARRTTRWQFFQWYWGDAIAVDGLLAASERGLEGAGAHAVDTITRWQEQCPASLDDALAPGRAIVELAARDAVPLEAPHRFMAAVDRLPRMTGNSIPFLEPHRPVFRFGVCIDAVYHLPAALVAYGRWQSRPELVRQGVAIANDAMRLLRCERGWSQWYDDALARNNGAVWTRGLGWALLGLLDVVQIAEDTSLTACCQETAAAIMELLSSTIGDDGTWPGILEDAEAQHETSTSAFFVAAAHHPALDDAARPSRELVDRALAAMTRSLSDDGILQGVSADILPSFDIAPYRHFATEPSPWGQGAALRALASVE